MTEVEAIMHLADIVDSNGMWIVIAIIVHGICT